MICRLILNLKSGPDVADESPTLSSFEQNTIRMVTTRHATAFLGDLGDVLDIEPKTLHDEEAEMELRAYSSTSTAVDSPYSSTHIQN